MMNLTIDARYVPSQQIWTIFYNIKLSSNQSQNDKTYMTRNFKIKAARRKYLTTKNTLTQNLLIFVVSSNWNCLMSCQQTVLCRLLLTLPWGIALHTPEKIRQK